MANVVNSLSQPTLCLVTDILVKHVIATVKVPDFDFCELQCYHQPNCVSINFNVIRVSKGLHECELNNATHRSYGNELLNRDGYIYKGADSACDRAVCENGGTCQSGFTDKGYRCVSPPNFFSAHCEKECLIPVLLLDVTTRLTHGRTLHRILCKPWHPVDLLYHNVPSMSSLSTLQVPFSFFSPGVYREMDQHPVHEKLAILSAPSCSTKQDEHFHELLVLYLKAIRRGVLTLLSVTKCPYALFVNFTITSCEKFRQWRS
ncbi:uncharacterized protein LOC141860179 [Acropora palmata]|uniref:uncharacterized protein LOC141860179 n=1 Tax=Acropora palmata TaxID=6131 RepID=UPI003DA0B8A5